MPASMSRRRLEPGYEPTPITRFPCTMQVKGRGCANYCLPRGYVLTNGEVAKGDRCMSHEASRYSRAKAAMRNEPGAGAESARERTYRG